MDRDDRSDDRSPEQWGLVPRVGLFLLVSAVVAALGLVLAQSGLTSKIDAPQGWAGARHVGAAVSNPVK
jgi:hypothetical protein